MPYKTNDKAEADALRRVLGRRIRDGREARGWSQEWVAEQVGVGAEMLSRYERGVLFPSHLTLLRLARTLGTTTDALYGVDAASRIAAEDALLRDFARLDAAQRGAVDLIVRDLAAPGLAARRPIAAGAAPVETAGVPDTVPDAALPKPRRSGAGATKRATKRR
jgi:transcriptional regulator with XRE-family HTH domain